MAATWLFSSMTVNAAPTITGKQNADYMMATNADGVPNWFNGNYYGDKYADLKIAFNDNEKLLYNHSLNYGFKEARLVTQVLDVAKYRAFYPDLDKAFGDNWELYIKHYFEYGIAEGRKNFTDFDAQTYLSMHLDLQNEFGDDLGLAARHYIEFGITEGRAYNWSEPEIVYVTDDGKSENSNSSSTDNGSEDNDSTDNGSEDNDSTGNGSEDTTGGSSGDSSTPSEKNKVTAYVEDRITVVAGGSGSNPVPVALEGAVYKTIENVTREEFSELEAQLKEKLTVEYSDGIEVHAYPIFAEEYYNTNWETTDVEFIVVVDVFAYEETESGDYTYTVTIPPDLLTIEEDYEYASVEATGKVTVAKPEAEEVDIIYIEMETAPVFTTNQITDEYGTTGVEFSIDYDSLFVYSVDDAYTVNEVVNNCVVEYTSDGYCVWNENENGKNTSVEYTLNIEMDLKEGYTFGEGIDSNDIMLCNGVATGIVTVTECDSQTAKLNILFTVTVEDLESMVNAQE